MPRLYPVELRQRELPPQGLLPPGWRCLSRLSPAVLQEVNTSIAACAAALPGRPPRAQTEEETLGTQIQRIAKRVAAVMESQVEEFERKRARRIRAA